MESADNRWVSDNRAQLSGLAFDSAPIRTAGPAATAAAEPARNRRREMGSRCAGMTHLYLLSNSPCEAFSTLGYEKSFDPRNKIPDLGPAERASAGWLGVFKASIPPNAPLAQG